MAYAQMLSSAIETKVYETLHSLLGQIAKDYELSHGELVEKYLVQGREGSPPPQFIYTKGDLEDEEAPVAPKKAKKAKVKVTKAKSESDEEDDREGKCTAVTAKGLPCKNKAFGGGCTCRVHTAKEGDEKKAKEPKEKAPAKRGRKPKAKEPEHSHKMDELAASDCELCETHGNPIEGEQEFEVVDAAKVVAALRAEESDSEEDDDEKASVVWTEDNLSEEEIAALAAEMEEDLEAAEEELD